MSARLPTCVEYEGLLMLEGYSTSKEVQQDCVGSTQSFTCISTNFGLRKTQMASIVWSVVQMPLDPCRATTCLPSSFENSSGMFEHRAAR